MMRTTALLLMVSTAGCQLVWGFEEFDAEQAPSGTGGHGVASGGAHQAESGGASNSGTGGTSAGGDQGDAAASGGSAGQGPCELGQIERNDRCYTIDEREVTRAQYRAFLSQLTDLAAYKDVPCQDKADFTPACNGEPLPAEGDDLPVTCVDWCDARAYCKHQGKELCSDDVWQAACVAGGPQYNYPYGTLYEPDVCNGKDNTGYGCLPTCSLSPAGDHDGCATPHGILDLSGNASEWTTGCSGNSNMEQTCAVRGGNVSDGASGLTCQVKQNPPRRTRTPLLGFRCCAELAASNSP